MGGGLYNLLYMPFRDVSIVKLYSFNGYFDFANLVQNEQTNWK